jgi:hypothetical protein
MSSLLCPAALIDRRDLSYFRASPPPINGWKK